LIKHTLNYHGIWLSFIHQISQFNEELAESFFNRSFWVSFDHSSLDCTERLEAIKGTLDEAVATSGKSWVDSEYEHTFDTTALWA
jgi:hypothetical protein